MIISPEKVVAVLPEVDVFLPNQDEIAALSHGYGLEAKARAARAFVVRLVDRTMRDPGNGLDDTHLNRQR